MKAKIEKRIILTLDLSEKDFKILKDISKLQYTIPETIEKVDYSNFTSYEVQSFLLLLEGVLK